jgi:hypothetical protein
MNLHPEILMSLAIGLGLSACCGFRVFVPLLIASIAAKFGWLPMSENFSWLSSWPALIAFATASVAEILAYYIPVVDNLLDTIATPSAMIAGTLISASTLVHLDPTWQWILGIIVGGGSAGLIQAGTGIARLGSTKFTAGTGNGVLATGENAAAIGGSIMALALPFVMAGIVLLLIVVIVYAVAKFFFHKKAEISN